MISFWEQESNAYTLFKVYVLPGCQLYRLISLVSERKELIGWVNGLYCLVHQISLYFLFKKIGHQLTFVFNFLTVVKFRVFYKQGVVTVYNKHKFTIAVKVYLEFCDIDMERELLAEIVRQKSLDNNRVFFNLEKVVNIFCWSKLLVLNPHPVGRSEFIRR